MEMGYVSESNNPDKEQKTAEYYQWEIPAPFNNCLTAI